MLQFFDPSRKSNAYDSITAAIAPHPLTLILPEIEYSDFPSGDITAYFANDTILLPSEY